MSGLFEVESLKRPAAPYLDLVPILSGERILGSLLETLLSLGEALVPTALLEPVRCDGCASRCRSLRWLGSFRKVALSILMPGINSLSDSHICDKFT